MKESNPVVTDNNLKDAVKEYEQFYIDYALKNWIERYRPMRRLLKELRMPNIVVELTDMPKGSSDPRNSKVEGSAVKRVYAEEWIKVFFEKIFELDDMEQRIIEMKYTNIDGQRLTDDQIYPDLYINRTLYYQIKRKALVSLGTKLYGVFYENETDDI